MKPHQFCSLSLRERVGVRARKCIAASIVSRLRDPQGFGDHFRCLSKRPEAEIKVYSVRVRARSRGAMTTRVNSRGSLDPASTGIQISEPAVRKRFSRFDCEPRQFPESS
jgi:hypothetical protein